MRTRIWIPGLLVVMTAWFFAGCSSNQSESTQGEATHAEATQGEAMHGDTQATATAVPVSWDEAELTVLAHADEADGTVDHIVSQCGLCQLHMAGKADLAVKAGDYELRFCSEQHVKDFSEDLHASLLKFPMPEDTAVEETQAH